ncbi:MAG: nickel pincer cofactor biosynthesis protein LarC [Myxococcota bacterium]|jgi:hypothetical protein|nr:nickel pincer cofactor biosynthesis protein LarC [Myxococcota bacterium]
MTEREHHNETLLHFDCGSGLAGDMIVASLMDLGVPLNIIEGAVCELPLSGYKIRFEQVERSGLRASRFVVDVDESQQPHRHYGDIVELIASSGLSADVKALALKVFERIGKAEAAVHGVPLDRVHFHEVGAVDSIIDIVGAAAALRYLDAFVTCAPIPLGHGTVTCAHGVLPVPAPATLRIVEGLPVYDGDVASELTTPTGAAIAAVAAQRFCHLPPMTVQRTGVGAGTRVLSDRPNVLRAVLGERSSATASSEGCVVMEANIDDMTGEVAAVAMTALLAQGALDVWFAPIQMKKGRPALQLGVLCPTSKLESLAEVLLTETSTIGLRFHEVGRMEMSREMRVVETVYGPVNVKLCRGPGKSSNAAPEFEDCRRVAKEKGVPVKQVLLAAAGEAQKLLSSLV